MSSASNQPSEEKVFMTVRIDRELRDQVKEYAKKTDNTVSRLVRQLLRHLLDEAETAPDEAKQF